MLDVIVPTATIVIALIVSGLIGRRYIENMVFDYVNDLKGEVIDIAPKFVEQLGDTILQKFKASIMGMKSGAVRGQKAATRKLISEVIQAKNPLVSMFIQRIPELKDMLAENPEALMQLMPLAQKLLGGGSGSTSQSFAVSPSPSTNLNNPYWRCV